MQDESNMIEMELWHRLTSHLHQIFVGDANGPYHNQAKDEIWDEVYVYIDASVWTAHDQIGFITLLKKNNGN